MITTTQSIPNLQAQWHTLQDLDRAEAVSTIHKSGVSLRHLARALNCSEGLLRHLLRARAATPEDLALARRGEISTWELARRYVTSRTAMAMTPQEDSESDITSAATNGCQTIRRWLAEQSLDNPYGVQVIKEARRLLVNAARAGKLPCEQAPAGLTTDEIIRRTRPKEPETQNAEVTSWYALWLARWTCYAIPAVLTRLKALDLSLENGSVSR